MQFRSSCTRSVGIGAPLLTRKRAISVYSFALSRQLPEALRGSLCGPPARPPQRRLRCPRLLPHALQLPRETRRPASVPASGTFSLPSFVHSSSAMACELPPSSSSLACVLKAGQRKALLPVPILVGLNHIEREEGRNPRCNTNTLQLLDALGIRTVNKTNQAI